LRASIKATAHNFIQSSQ